MPSPLEGRRWWLAGIGGAGMSAYALLAQAWGAEVRGWDRVQTPYLDRLRNAPPGQLGTLGLRPIEGPGSWSFDANVQKSIRVHESRNLTFRLDASNVFNHPTPGNPNLNINTGTFGQITMKTGNRSLQALVRFEF